MIVCVRKWGVFLIVFEYILPYGLEGVSMHSSKYNVHVKTWEDNQVL